MITPRYDGQRWRIQIQKEGKRYSFSSSLPGPKGKKECKEKFERWYYEGGDGSKTVERVCKEYLEDLGNRRGYDSEAYIQAERYIRLYILPKCHSRKMNKMTLREWQSVINTATGAKKALSHKTLQNLRGTISAIVKFGYADYQCEMLRGDLYIPLGHSKKEKEILQPQDIKRLFEPSDKWYHPLFCFLLLTGLRPSEGLGIQLSDIDGDRVYINRGINSRGQITSLKNDNAKRMIPLGSLARQIITETVARNNRRNLNTPWVFCDKHGDKGNQSTMRNNWIELKKERNLPGTIYGLRHTFISMMKTNLAEQTIKDIVGHSVSMTTFETYGHLVDGEDRKAAQIIDLTYGALLGEEMSTSGGLSRT